MPHRHRGRRTTGRRLPVRHIRLGPPLPITRRRHAARSRPATSPRRRATELPGRRATTVRQRRGDRPADGARSKGQVGRPAPSKSAATSASRHIGGANSQARRTGYVPGIPPDRCSTVQAVRPARSGLTAAAAEAAVDRCRRPLPSGVFPDGLPSATSGPTSARSLKTPPTPPRNRELHPSPTPTGPRHAAPAAGLRARHASPVGDGRKAAGVDIGSTPRGGEPRAPLGTRLVGADGTEAPQAMAPAGRTRRDRPLAGRQDRHP